MCSRYARDLYQPGLDQFRETLYPNGTDRFREEHAIARTLFMKTPSWFTGGNIPGKKRGMLAYLGGMGNFTARCKTVAEKSYEGFIAT